MINRMDLSHYLGIMTDEPCPCCSENIIQDASGVRWCIGEECTWSNDPELQEFMNLMKKDETN